MIDLRGLKWYELTLNEVLVRVNDIKINKTSHGTWIANNSTTNATSGKQGAKQPLEATENSTTIQIQPDIPTYLYKPSELSFREVKMLLERYACPICRKNNHAFLTCHALRNTYNISLKAQSIAPTSDSSTSSVPPNTAPQPVMANRATTSVDVLPDVPERYEGYESIIVPPPDSDSEESKTYSEHLQSLEDTIRVSKINEHSTTYSNFVSKFTFNVGSVRQCDVYFSKKHCFRISSTVNNEYPIIIDSGATQHMWRDSNAFLNFTFMKQCYVTLANNY